MWEGLQSGLGWMQASFEQAPLLISLLYFAVFTGLTALCLPGASVLMLAGGSCMGLAWCLLLSNLASAVGATLTLLAARYSLKDWVYARWGTHWAAINARFEEDQVTWIISLRLAPIVPFVALNALAGLSPIKPWTFLWASFVGMLPGTAAYVYAGHALGQVDNPYELLGTEMMVGLGLLAVLPWGLKGLNALWQRSRQR